MDRANTVDALLRQRADLPAAHPDRQRLRQQAVEAGLPLVGSIARRYAGRGEPLDDLKQVAAIGLLNAVDRFDPAYNTEFWVYAKLTILGVLKHYFRDSTWAVGVPRRYKDLRLMINHCLDEATQQLRRVPNVAELAEWLGVDQCEIMRSLMAGNGYVSASLYAPTGPNGSTLCDDLDEMEPGYDAVDLHESLHRCLARLPRRDQRIIALRFFGNMTQAQIADEIGVSQMHVSRLLAGALQRLRVFLQDSC